MPELARNARRLVVTGSRGFLGRNLVARLSCREDLEVQGFDVSDTEDSSIRLVQCADVVVHLAGANRPPDVSGCVEGNEIFTRTLCSWLEEANRTPHILFSSSIQAERDNPYGKSRRAAEDVLVTWAREHSDRVDIFRFHNIFGKWGVPDYNSTVTTFCHHISRNLDIRVDDAGSVLQLVYVDDVVSAIERMVDSQETASVVGTCFREVEPVVSVSVGALVARLREFRPHDSTCDLPALETDFDRKLYATYLSYRPAESLEVHPDLHADGRSHLGELLRDKGFGQLLASTTAPGVVRGNHYHNTKVEYFTVLAGVAAIRLRRVDDSEVVEYRVDGDRFGVVVVPPGYAHSLENVGTDDLVTLFWSSEVYDEHHPDTHPATVVGKASV
jgi:UDP-2-acetamido-2,6-beta-L-arabino-hexul-4-ose reductase